MRILLFHPVRLPPRNYGGVERVVQWLARGLQERGHQVSVAADEASKLPPGIELLPMRPPHITGFDLLEALKEKKKDYDLIHFMAPLEPGLMERLPSPMLLTVHGNGQPAEQYPLNTVFLSRDHALRHGSERFVYNGIDPLECRFDPALKAPGNAYLFLSKTSWRVKNLRGAMALCSQAGVPLEIAGGLRPWGLRLKAAIPWPGRPSMRWLGPVNGDEKALALARARALVFPVLWPEPFGLVVVEALMSGTPVIASPRGSLPELVTPEVGFLPENSDQWIEILRRPALGIDPAACRDYAIQKFHYRSMAEAYERMYGEVVQGKNLNQTAPRTMGVSPHVA